MLVLTRHVGEKIRIGDNITLTLIEVGSGGKVRLAIEAPRDVPIWREELLPIRPQPPKPGEQPQ
jgi:carbon storage regulator